MGNTELFSTQCRGIGPHLTVTGKSHGFPRVVMGTCGIFSSYGGDGPSKLEFIQRRLDSCLVTRETSAISARLGISIGMQLEVRRVTDGPFPVAPGILGFLSIFKKSEELSPYEALNSAWLSRCQRDVAHPVQMRRGPRAFSRISTVDSDTPSFCEMKDVPAFKPLRGNPAFFRVRESQCPFHLRQHTQGSSHIVLLREASS